ncbi:hypothetical protein ACWIG5_28640 [Streptomyces lydicus]
MTRVHQLADAAGSTTSAARHAAYYASIAQAANAVGTVVAGVAFGRPAGLNSLLVVGVAITVASMSTPVALITLARSWQGHGEPVGPVGNR